MTLIKKISSSLVYQLAILLIIVVLTTLVYIDHFDNPFFFDDTHTISSNESIQSLDNWSTFFTDAKTFSSLPANRAYRPMITLMNAIDYSWGDGLNAEYFHYHIFFWFVVLICLFFMLVKHIYNKSSFVENRALGGPTFLALFSTAYFALHTTNAETINYICARSDSFSTLCIVISLILYINPWTKKYYLYIITMVIGIWTKQTGLMFVPILSLYVVLFEEDTIWTSLFSEPRQFFARAFFKVLPAALIGISLFLVNQKLLTPDTTDSTNFQVTVFEYASTQCYVILHYIGNFILPIDLSADPDIKIIKPWYDKRILIGAIVIVGLLYAMYKTAIDKSTRPIAFGLGWFFVALIPTSLVPLFQIANDHRVFFPYIGLFIAVPWFIYSKLIELNITNLNKIVGLLCFFIIGAYAYGITLRNEVWKDSESLWYDVSLKSPTNGRGLMNYGLTQMSEGKYDIAEEYFLKALKYVPNYYVLHINLGVLNSAKNNDQEAEYYFKKALGFNSTAPEAEYYYARYLHRKGKSKEAIPYLKKAIKKSPNHTNSKKLLSLVQGSLGSNLEQIKDLIKQAEQNPSVSVYLKLSNRFYDKGDYKNSVIACLKLLKLDSMNLAAYNNLCASYNQLGQWENGIAACEQALSIDPNYQLAKNNLNWAKGALSNQ